MRDKILIIYWNDTTEKAEWADADEIESAQPEPCRTVGFLRKRTKTKITVSGTLASDGHGNRTTIPIGCIVRMYCLEQGDKYV